MESQRPFLVDEEHDEEVVVEALLGRKRDRDGGGVNGGGNGGEDGHHHQATAAGGASRSSSSCCTESGVGDEVTEEADQVEEEEEEGGIALFSVHFDKEQGVWKCRHCDWTYSMEIPLLDHIRHYKDPYHVPMNDSTRERHFNSETKGSERIDEHIEQVKGGIIEEAIFDTDIGDRDFPSYHSDTNKTPVNVESDHIGVKALEKEDCFGFDPTFQKEPPAEHGMHNDALNNGYKVDESDDFIKEEEEVEVEGIDYDVERVLAKQNTHDLECPNCHSCITRTVILRRRKRKVRSIRRKPTLTNKPETVTKLVAETSSPSLTDDQQGQVTKTISSDQTPQHSVEEGHTDDDVNGFRCLSCFSFFIPTGSGFKLFRTSRSNTENETVQLSQDATSAKTNWFFSIFTPDKARSITEEGTIVTDNSKAEESYLHQSNAEAAPLILSRGETGDVRPDNSQGQESSQSPSKEEEPTIQNTKDDPRRSSSSSLIALPDQDDQNGHLVALNDKEHKAAVTIEEHATDNQATETTEIHQTGQNITISTTIGFPALANLTSDDGWKAVSVADGNHKAAPHVKEPIQVLQALSTTGTNSDRIDASISSPVGVPLTEKVQVDGQQKDFAAIKKQDTGNNLEVIVQSVPLSYAASQRAPDDGTSVEVRSTLQSGTREQTPRVAGVGIDILKSIVYGGLIESITSLGVVSSAAGGGATTMNILALGLANLIGGLFVIFHNLFDLKSDRLRANSDQTSEQDRYQELLGRRGHFPLHATVAILSYLIFGLLPPVVYGVAYRTSDNRDYKLAAVGIASLICIILLAVGKAHVQGQRSYIKTMLYYVILGVMASGASYVVGDLIDILLKKIGWTESSSLALTMTFPESGPPERPWSSY